MVLGKAVGGDMGGQEVESGEGQRDLFKAAYALGCPPVEISPPDDDGFRLYAIDSSKADPEKLEDLRACYVTLTPVEETPEEHAKRLEDGLAAVAEYEAEFGAFTPEDEAWPRRYWTASE